MGEGTYINGVQPISMLPLPPNPHPIDAFRAPLSVRSDAFLDIRQRNAKPQRHMITDFVLEALD